MKPNIDKLVAEAREMSKGRIHNGRPYVGLPKDQAEVASAMAKRQCSISVIYKVMKKHGLTDYNSYPAFSAAYNSYKLHKN
jgi:hypothetical protein